MFSENSGLVKIWAKMVQNDVYTLEQVPSLGNLIEVVTAVVGVSTVPEIEGDGSV